MIPDNDLDIFFQTADFAQTAVYTVSGGSPVTITGVFVNEYEAASLMGLDVMSNSPLFITKATNVSNAGKGDVIIINSITYSVLSVRDDNLNMRSLVLSKYGR